MATFVIPKPTRKELDAMDEMESMVSFSNQRREVFSIPANQALVDMLKAGEEYVVTLKGTVTEVRDIDREAEDESSRSFDMELVSVDVKEESEFSKLLDEDE
jgi:hypothetical protein